MVGCWWCGCYRLSWTCQKDDSNEFFNPLICISTTRMDKIEESFKVLIKGKKYSIRFSEVGDRSSLIGKVMPMQDDPFSWNEILRHEPEVHENVSEISDSKAINSEVFKDNNSQHMQSSLEDSMLSASFIPESSLEDNRVVHTFDKVHLEVGNVDHVLEPNKLQIREGVGSFSSLSSEEQISNSIMDKLSFSGDSRLLEEHNRISSQGTLCKDLWHLKMKGAGGRPRKMVRSVKKNPFDLGIGKRKLGKSFKTSKISSNRCKVLGAPLSPVRESVILVLNDVWDSSL